MVAVPGDTPAETLAAIIADEIAIGVFNNKTTAVRIIPVPGKEVGEKVVYGGLLGEAHVQPVSRFRSDASSAAAGAFPRPCRRSATDVSAAFTCLGGRSPRWPPRLAGSFGGRSVAAAGAAEGTKSCVPRMRPSHGRHRSSPGASWLLPPTGWTEPASISRLEEAGASPLRAPPTHVSGARQLPEKEPANGPIRGAPGAPLLLRGAVLRWPSGAGRVLNSPSRTRRFVAYLNGHDGSPRGRLIERRRAWPPHLTARRRSAFTSRSPGALPSLRPPTATPGPRGLRGAAAAARWRRVGCRGFRPARAFERGGIVRGPYLATPTEGCNGASPPLQSTLETDSPGTATFLAWVACGREATYTRFKVDRAATT